MIADPKQKRKIKPVTEHNLISRQALPFWKLDHKKDFLTAYEYQYR